MYVSLRLRFQHTIHHLCAALATDHSIFFTMATRAATTPDLARYQHSSASAPSLRSREPIDVMDRPLTPMEGDGGNVKVVVRVRKFVPRGERKGNPVLLARGLR